MSQQALPLAAARTFGAPVLAVCGFSGSGKTTLLEAVIPHLVRRGLAVAMVKHDAHGFVVDKPGKDSDRFFKAGATVALRGPGEQFHRRGGANCLSLEATVTLLARDHDIVLVEGHKDTTLPKLWLGNEEGTPPPDEVTGVLEILPWNSDRLTHLLHYIDLWLPQAWNARPLYAGLLVGGRSSRMGTPKQLVEFGGRTLGEIVALALSAALATGAEENGLLMNQRLVILGAGGLPPALQGLTRLADPPELGGPLAGLLAAHRWHPRAAWILAACDHPRLQASDVEQLLAPRQPGTWAVIPRQADGHPYSTLALYEPQALQVLERSLVEAGSERARIATLFDHPRTHLLAQPTPGLFNANTPQDLRTAEEIF